VKETHNPCANGSFCRRAFHNPTNTPVGSWANRFPLEFDLIEVVHRNGAKALCSLCHITRVALHGTGFSGYGRRDDARRI
jgi:hypothetical protein